MHYGELVRLPAFAECRASVHLLVTLEVRLVRQVEGKEWRVEAVLTVAVSMSPALAQGVMVVVVSKLEVATVQE